MTHNVASWDRVLRIVVGGVLLFIGWTEVVRGWPGILLMVVGLVPLLSGVTGWCPIYSWLGLSTTHDGPRRPAHR
jgi:hypothetical protein